MGNRFEDNDREGMRDRKRRGWGMGLYRNRARGWLGGVCAGLADHWDVATWIVRLGALALLIFTGSIAFWAYLAGWFLLAPKPTRWDDSATQYEVAMEYDENAHTYRKRKVFTYSEAPSERLRKARARLDAALQRVETMERYVTSRRYDLNREFSKL